MKRSPYAADGEYDLIVVGAGMCGLTAALAARQRGLRVLLVEKTPTIPGYSNSLVSGGLLHAAGLDPFAASEAKARAVELATDGTAAPELVQAFAQTSADAVRWAVGNGAEMADGYGGWPSALAPVKGFDAGLHAEGFGADRFLTRLAEAFSRLGGQALPSTRATALRTKAGRVCGADVESSDGRAERYTARLVLLADGGFAADAALVRRYLGTGAYKLRATPTSTGDALLMATAVGAQTTSLTCFYGHPLHRDALGSDKLWPYPALDVLAMAGAVVSGTGQVLRARDGIGMANAMMAAAGAPRWWLIIDRATWVSSAADDDLLLADRLRAGHATISACGGLREVLRACGIPAAPSALAGHSPALSHGRGRYLAMPTVPGITFTMGGLCIDGRARVLGPDNRPLAGLLAAGGTAGGLHGGPRAGYAGGLLAALTFGFIAAQTATAVIASGA